MRCVMRLLLCAATVLASVTEFGGPELSASAHGVC